MTLIKHFLKILTVGALLSSANIFAGDLLVNTTIDDSHDNGSGGWKYDIEKMDVQWASDNTVTVDIYTNFVDYNNKYATYSKHNNFTGNIVLGDLLISTNGENTPYNYAFVLSDADRSADYSYNSGNHWDKTGSFTEISSTLTAKEYHNNSVNVSSGTVMAGVTVGNAQQGSLSIDRVNAKYGFDVISFSFNVGGIDAFQNASQLAFSWGMSCANDIVAGIANVTRPSGGTTKVPEPATLLLMLAALAFMVNSRNKKANKFSA